MTEQLRPPPTRQAVLFLHAAAFRQRTGLSHEEWGERVDREYCRLVPEAHRNVRAPDLAQVTGAADFQKLRRAWDEQLRRYESGRQHFPLELEEAWVAALEEPYRGACLRELAERFGLYGARRRPVGPAGDYAALADLLADQARVTEDMSRILEDEQMNAADAPLLPQLIDHLKQLETHSVAMRRRAEDVLAGCRAPGNVRRLR